MEWWQFFVVAGAFGCTITLYNLLSRPTTLFMISQEVGHYGWLVILGRLSTGLVAQFVLYGAILGTALWFLYWLIFD